MKIIEEKVRWILKDASYKAPEQMAGLLPFYLGLLWNAVDATDKDRARRKRAVSKIATGLAVGVATAE